MKELVQKYIFYYLSIFFAIAKSNDNMINKIILTFVLFEDN